MEKPRTIPVFIIAILLLSFQIPTIFFSENFEGQEVEMEKVAMPPVEVQAVVTGSLPQVNAGYCQLGQSTVTFTYLGQSGDPLESQINDLRMGIGLGSFFQLSDGAFEITGIRIAGVDLDFLSPSIALHGNSQFANDPDGIGGLNDLDSDGFFDDLDLGGSVEITAFYRLDCGLTNSNTGNCFNDLSTSLSARMDYFEQGSPQSIELENYLEPSHRSVEILNSSSPDAFLGVDNFYITHRQVRFRF